MKFTKHNGIYIPSQVKYEIEEIEKQAFTIEQEDKEITNNFRKKVSLVFKTVYILIKYILFIFLVALVYNRFLIQ